MIQTLKRFIRIKTVTTGTNARLARGIGSFLRKSGFRVTYQTLHKSGGLFVNVIGRMGPKGRGLLLSAHLDTVPPGDFSQWTRTRANPWLARLSRGKIFGLGAADDKGPMVSILSAALDVRAKKLKRPLIVVGTFGEESGMGGARLFTQKWKGPKPLAAFIAEPSNLGLTYRHKGYGVVEIILESKLKIKKIRHAKKVSFIGKQVHSSVPHLGVNALDKAVEFLKKKNGPRESVFIFHLNGGHAPNLVPARSLLSYAASEPLSLQKNGAFAFPAKALLVCRDAVQKIVRVHREENTHFEPARLTSSFAMARTEGNALRLTFDFRLLPHQSFQTILKKLRGVLSQKLPPYGLAFKIRVERDNPPLGMKENHPLAKLGRHLQKESGIRPRLIAKSGCTEAGLFYQWGVPALVFGPGQSAGNIHAPNERISIAQIKKAARFYRNAIQKICVEGHVFSSKR